jgi:hypothetical protein
MTENLFEVTPELRDYVVTLHVGTMPCYSVETAESPIKAAAIAARRIRGAPQEIGRFFRQGPLPSDITLAHITTIRQDT